MKEEIRNPLAQCRVLSRDLQDLASKRPIFISPFPINTIPFDLHINELILLRLKRPLQQLQRLPNPRM
jgi:hypothetical protein